MKTQKNNREVFVELYDEFMPKVYRYIFFKINDEKTAEDLTSATFEKALSAFERYSKDKAAFSTWIFSIARNTLVDFFRTNKARLHVSLDEAAEAPSKGPEPHEEAENKEEKELLRNCLSKLPEQDQEILRLKFSAEFNNRQIAKMVGISESNVGVRLFRAVKRLREAFNASWNK